MLGRGKGGRGLRINCRLTPLTLFKTNPVAQMLQLNQGGLVGFCHPSFGGTACFEQLSLSYSRIKSRRGKDRPLLRAAHTHDYDRELEEDTTETNGNTCIMEWWVQDAKKPMNVNCAQTAGLTRWGSSHGTEHWGTRHASFAANVQGAIDEHHVKQ